MRRLSFKVLKKKRKKKRIQINMLAAILHLLTFT